PSTPSLSPPSLHDALPIFQRAGSVLADLDLETLSPEQVGQRLGEIGLVLYQQDPGHSLSPSRAIALGWSSLPACFLDFFFCFFFGVAGSGASMRGSRMVKVDPFPGRDHTRTSPP